MATHTRDLRKPRRLPVTCPICGKVHTHMAAEYRKILKTGVGLCCSRTCGHIRSMRSQELTRAIKQVKE